MEFCSSGSTFVGVLYSPSTSLDHEGYSTSHWIHNHRSGPVGGHRHQPTQRRLFFTRRWRVADPHSGLGRVSGTGWLTFGRLGTMFHVEHCGLHSLRDELRQSAGPRLPHNSPFSCPGSFSRRSTNAKATTTALSHDLRSHRLRRKMFHVEHCRQPSPIQLPTTSHSIYHPPNQHLPPSHPSLAQLFQRKFPRRPPPSLPTTLATF